MSVLKGNNNFILLYFFETLIVNNLSSWHLYYLILNDSYNMTCSICETKK